MKYSRCIVSIVFLISALFKLLDYDATVGYFSNIFPIPFYVYQVGVGLVILCELVLSLLILYTKSRMIVYCTLSFIGFFILLTLFLLLNKYTNCGCFGTRITIHPAVTLIKNIVLGLLLLNIKNRGIIKNEI